MRTNFKEETIQEEVNNETKHDKNPVISYRLKCSESGNGLSHYIMYGDIPEENRE